MFHFLTASFPLKCVFSNPGRKVSPNHIVSCKNCFSTVNVIVSIWENLITTYTLICIYLTQEGFVFVGAYVYIDIYYLQSRKEMSKEVFFTEPLNWYHHSKSFCHYFKLCVLELLCVDKCTKRYQMPGELEL